MTSTKLYETSGYHVFIGPEKVSIGEVFEKDGDFYMEYLGSKNIISWLFGWWRKGKILPMNITDFEVKKRKLYDQRGEGEFVHIHYHDVFRGVNYQIIEAETNKIIVDLQHKNDVLMRQLEEIKRDRNELSDPVLIEKQQMKLASFKHEIDKKLKPIWYGMGEDGDMGMLGGPDQKRRK